MSSDCIIVDGERVRLPEALVFAGVTATNYLDDVEPRFRCSPRGRGPIHFVLHETCGGTAQGCKNTLLRKGYGVQLILAPNGHLSCHGDLVRDRMVHANQLNGTSFGCEVVNPYVPSYVRDKAVWADILPAAWWTWVPRQPDGSRDRRYVCPTRQQMEAMRLLAPWLCEVAGVPYVFPTRGLNRKQRKIDGWDRKPAARPGPGVVAHQDFAGHADGRYMLEDLIAREV